MMVDDNFDKLCRIVYIMNVDWDWAKQRPHFLAQHLAIFHDVIILYPYSWRRINHSKNDRDGVKVYPFFRFPFGGRFAFISKINALLLRVIANIFLRCYRPDIIWISSPELYEYLPKIITAKLIYDCMDDVLAFPSNSIRKDFLLKSESKLIEVSSNVFCSSNSLKAKLTSRYGFAEKYSVVFNAFEPSAFCVELADLRVKRSDGFFVLGYIGTISSWFDFDSIISIVGAIRTVEIHLIGPVENLLCPLPQHERIKYLGVISHSRIQSCVNEFDALLMPFQVTDLIQSVDPVKLYEYVFFNKPIISVWYSEIDKFSDFVDFYDDKDEFILIVKRYLNEGFKKKYTDKKREDFISENNWLQRAKIINKKISCNI